MALAFALAALSFVAEGHADPAKFALIEGCVPCHGADGIAKFGEVPNLAGQNELYLLNQLHAFHEGKRAHKEMGYMSRHLTEEEMADIARYFAALPPR